MSTVTFPASTRGAGIPSTAVSADLKVQPVLLCYSSLDEVRDWHSLHAGANSPKRIFFLFPHMTVAPNVAAFFLTHNVRAHFYP